MFRDKFDYDHGRKRRVGTNPRGDKNSSNYKLTENDTSRLFSYPTTESDQSQEVAHKRQQSMKNQEAISSQFAQIQIGKIQSNKPARVNSSQIGFCNVAAFTNDSDLHENESELSIF